MQKTTRGMRKWLSVRMARAFEDVFIAGWSIPGAGLRISEDHHRGAVRQLISLTVKFFGSACGLGRGEWGRMSVEDAVGSKENFSLETYF